MFERLQPKEEKHPNTYEGETPPDQIHRAWQPGWNLEYPETTPEQIAVREFLGTVDNRVLRDIYAEHLQKAGSGAIGNYVPTNEIVIQDEYAPEPSTCGGYEADKGVILFANNIYHNQAETLWTTMHEDWHALTYNGKIDETDAVDPDTKYQEEVAGFSKHLNTLRRGADGTFTEVDKVRQGEKINEGLTELLTEKVFDEYLRRTGQKISGLEETRAGALAGAGLSHYVDDAVFYISLLSTLTETSYEQTEGAVIRTYLRNGQIFPEEVNDALAERHPYFPYLIHNYLESMENTGVTGIHNLIAEMVQRGYINETEQNTLNEVVDQIQTKRTNLINDLNTPLE